MKKFVLSIVSFVAIVSMSHSHSFAQNADAILGQWYTAEDKSIVDVWKADGAYNAKIIWLKDSLDAGKPKLDKNNGKEALRVRPIIGLQILAGLKFKDGEWVDGTIYDPENGKDYSCKATMNGAKLDLRGYIFGMPFLGRTTTWRKK